MADTSRASDANMILIMGVTGSGKSHFINTLAGREVVQEGAHLDSCTAVCQMIPVAIGQSKVLLIDTPGFDDSERSDVEILTEISKLLATQYKLGISLKGVIYLHRIADIRYQGSASKTLSIFTKLCGEESLRNVYLCTTRWDRVSEVEGAARESRLREKFWSHMMAKKATMFRSYGDRDSAVAMVSQLLGSGNIVLDIQRELIDEGLSLDQTAAGQEVNNNLSKQMQQSMDEIDRLRHQIQESDMAMRRQLDKEKLREQETLRQVQVDQVRLRTDIEKEVRDEMAVRLSRQKKKSSALGIILPLLPSALSILGMFVGIPPGVTHLLSSWIIGDDGDGPLSEIFSNF